MTKIEELIESIRQTGESQDFYEYAIERIMKEYAEWYALKCLYKANDYVFSSSIFIGDIELPEHE